MEHIIVNFTTSTSPAEVKLKHVSTLEWILINGFYVTCGTGGMLGNALLLTLFVKYRNLRRQDCVYLITILATGDLVASVGYIVTGGVNLYRRLGEIENIPTWRCLLSASLVVVGLYMDQLCMLSIAIDRLQALRRPFDYKNKKHKRYALATILVVFTFSLVAVYPGLFVAVDLFFIPRVCTIGGSGSQAYVVFYVTFTLMIVPSVLIVYIWVAYELIKMARVAHLQRFNSRQSRPNGPKTSGPKNSIVQATNAVRMGVTRTLVIIVTVYAITSGLPNVCFVLAAAHGMGMTVKGRLTLYIGVGSCFSTAINVIIYGKSHHLYKEHMMSFFKNQTPTTELLNSVRMRNLQRRQQRQVKPSVANNESRRV